MPKGKLIDLCISTDDEGFQPKPEKSGRLPAVKTNDSYFALPEVIDLEGGPRKKRKLSPVCRTNPEKLAVRNAIEPANLDSILPMINGSDHFLAIDDDDPIVGTSSPKQKLKPAPKSYSGGQPRFRLSDSDISLPDEEWLRMAPARPLKAPKRVSQIANVGFASEAKALEKSKPRRTAQSSHKVSKPRSNQTEGGNSDSSGKESMETKQSPVARTKRLKPTNEEKAARAREKGEAKAAAKAIRSQEQEALRERKRLLKEEQSREKQKEKDRAEANKLKLDKKLSTPEMIVDLPISIGESTVDTQIRECLKKIGVEIASHQGLIPNVIRWRRKVDSRFNPQTGAREKLQVKEIVPEKHVICLMSANEFVQLAASRTNTTKSQLDDHVSRTRSAFIDCTLIYLVEGLDAWMRKNRNAKNRAYQAAVLGQPGSNVLETSNNGTHPEPKRRKPRVEVVDEDVIEDSLVRLQVMHRCLVHHAAATVETAEWVAYFTEQISQIPYRYDPNLHGLTRTYRLQARTDGTRINLLYGLGTGEVRQGCRRYLHQHAFGQCKTYWADCLWHRSQISQR
ncbi:MAG: hypothetical protein LQ337_005178 [Flavoplaca oasis]|nr:MAG: hypothetical protein LQ337_005178 [Flavoplaca oasis]